MLYRSIFAGASVCCVMLATVGIGCASSSSSNASTAGASLSCDWQGSDGPGGCPTLQCRCADGFVPAASGMASIMGVCQPRDCSTTCAAHGGNGTSEPVPNIYDDPACHDLCRALKAAGCKDTFTRTNLDDACLVHPVLCSGGKTMSGDASKQQAYARCVAQNIKPECNGNTSSATTPGCTNAEQSPSACGDAGP